MSAPTTASPATLAPTITRIHLRESPSPPPWSHPLRELQERPQSVPHLFSSEFRAPWHVEITATDVARLLEAVEEGSSPQDVSTLQEQEYWPHEPQPKEKKETDR